MSGRTALVLGAARSGKSRFAEALAEATGLERVYLATAEIRDAEMKARIDAHRARRGAEWTTAEVPLALPEALGEWAAPGRVVLVDCLTLWLSNWIEAGRDPEAAGAALASGVASARGPVVLVSNEVGAGIVPANALARRFADAQGRLNQRAAAAAAKVVLVAAGLPILLKPVPAPEITL